MKTNVMFLSNGNTAVFDKHGQQVPHLQEAWIRFYVDFLKEQKVDLDKVEFEMPDGRMFSWFSDYNNWGAVLR